MSEYQYYEFQAVERPLSQEQMSRLRTYSSRAQITPSSFVNVYNYGNFKGDPNQWIEKYFDAFLYLANWGSRWFMLRLPKNLLEQRVAAPYCIGENLSCRKTDESIILSFRSEDEEPEWVEGEGWLATLIQTRADIMRGDHRALYLGWLLALQSGEIDDDALEPPVPPGLGDLNASLDRLADFLRIDSDLITASAARSLGEHTIDLTKQEIGTWLLTLSSKEKDAILSRLIEGRAPHLEAELRQRAVLYARGAGEPKGGPRRTAGDILAHATIISETRRKKEAERRAEEKARREREQAEKRRKHLESLAGREDHLWAEIDHLIATKLPKRYDEAVSLLKDLRDLATMKGETADFSSRMHALRNEHARKPSLMERFRTARLPG